MNAKIYDKTQIEKVGETLKNLPVIPKIQVDKNEAIQALAGEIKVLVTEKNYSPKQVAMILKENKILITQKEIKNICPSGYIGVKKKSVVKQIKTHKKED